MRSYKHIVIWGVGKEGKAAEAYIRGFHPDQKITFVDEATDKDVAGKLKEADLIVKSPGVSLYHPLLRGKNVTSLMNLWFSEPHTAKTVCITGTKGKSTTSSLLGHVLNKLGKKASVLGNIGVAISEAPKDAEYLIIETSSYQSANFDGQCDVAVVTSLYPEHLDWHGDIEAYYRDKLHLLGQADIKIVHRQVADVMGSGVPRNCMVVDTGSQDIPNDYLSRPHNRANVSIVLQIIKQLGLDTAQALAAMADFKGLPHRQQELGMKDGILYVDDSIATTPQSAMAAMDVYAGKPITVIVGGYDRGIDYAPLIDYLNWRGSIKVVGIGPSGERILKGVQGELAATMAEAVAKARAVTPSGGVVLLSPAAPSFGLFNNYIERGTAFAKESGF